MTHQTWEIWLIFIEYSTWKQQNILSPHAHEAFSRIDHIFSHKLNLGAFKKIEIISNIFFQPELYEIRNQIEKKKKKKNL